MGAMTPDERMLAVIRDVTPSEAPFVMAALWDALRARMVTNDSPDEWARWFETFVKGLRGER